MSGDTAIRGMDQALDGIRRAGTTRRIPAGVSPISAARFSMILLPSFWLWAKRLAPSAGAFKSSPRRAATSCRPSPIGELAEVGEDRELKRITSRFVAAAGRRRHPAAAGVRSGFDLFAPRCHAAIRHHRQRKRRPPRRRTDRPLRPDQRRHSSVGRRKSRETPTSRSGSRIASSRMPSSISRSSGKSRCTTPRAPSWRPAASGSRSFSSRNPARASDRTSRFRPSASTTIFCRRRSSASS